MSTLKIIKLQSGAFEHVDSIDGAFFLGRFNFKQEFNKAFLVEAYGAKRRTYGISEIEVFDFGGTAEPFTNWTDLINRLVDLGYTGIDTNSIPSGGGVWGSITGNIASQTDLQNELNTKLDKVTTNDVEKVYIKNADGTQGMKPVSEFGGGGTGTINRISKFTASGTIGDSQIFDDGTNVGIGTTSPTTVLDVHGNYTFNTGTARPLKIVGNSEATTIAGFGTGMVFGLKIGSGSVEDVACIDVINTETYRSGEISFKVSQGSSPVEAMRINYVGKVGIGTTSPQARLDVRAQGVLDTDIVLRVRNSTDTANLLQINGQGTLSLGLQSSAPTGIEGAIYYDSTTKKHRGFNGTAWNDLY